MRRVAITGMGIVSCIGNSLEEVAESLQAGCSGIEFVPERREMRFHSALSGTLKNLPVLPLPKRNLRQMGRGSILAFNAVQQALRDAALNEDDVRNEHTGVIIGNSGNMFEIFEQCNDFYHNKRRLSGTALQRVMASSVSANLSVLLGTQGCCMTVSTACASGATAIGTACEFIRSGLQECVICGGVQDNSWAYDCNFDALRVFSKREDEPTKASRPFDRYRDGLVPSGGSGIVVLEEYQRAVARGAYIHAELIGYGTNSDGFDMTTPSGIGSIKCIELALRDAGIDAMDVDYVNAHATSTVVGDVAEARAIAQTFGSKPYVSSSKSMTGHEIGTTGSSELIYTVLMMKHGFIAPNINIQEIDPECEGINLVANSAIDFDIGIAISNSFGFGGVNTCLLVKNPR
jgi:3-oxoacyl-[acyl-carrier-protein] synthase I